jgi:hypothetical protein
MQFHGNNHLPGPFKWILVSIFLPNLSGSLGPARPARPNFSARSALEISRPKNKKPTRLASGLKILFSLISLRESPPAIRMDAT